MGRDKLSGSSYPFDITGPAFKDLQKIDTFNKKRILKKLKYFSRQPDPLGYAAKMVNYEIGAYRWRIGNYRVLFDFEDSRYIILRIQHRKEVYRK